MSDRLALVHTEDYVRSQYFYEPGGLKTGRLGHVGLPRSGKERVTTSKIDRFPLTELAAEKCTKRLYLREL